MKILKKLFHLTNTKLNKRSKKKTNKDNISVFTSTEYQEIPNTCDAVFKQKKIFLGGGTYNKKTEKHENKLKIYNTFLKYIHTHQGNNGQLPCRERTEKDLSITRTERLKLIDQGIKSQILIKKANNKIYINKNINLEDIINGK